MKKTTTSPKTRFVLVSGIGALAYWPTDWDTCLAQAKREYPGRKCQMCDESNAVANVALTWVETKADYDRLKSVNQLWLAIQQYAKDPNYFWRIDQAESSVLSHYGVEPRPAVEAKAA